MHCNAQHYIGCTWLNCITVHCTIKSWLFLWWGGKCTAVWVSHGQREWAGWRGLCNFLQLFATVQQVGCTEHCTAILHSALHSAELFTFECPQLNILLRLMPAHASYCHQSSIARPAYARALYIQHHSVHKSDETQIQILCKSTCSIAHIFCRIILGKKGSLFVH